MYNTKFILSGNNEIYPGYADKEYRGLLRKKFNNASEYMWCGCRGDKKLFYRISDDLKIYPEHKNYEHDKHCIRYRNPSGEIDRKSAYVINDEDGQVTAYLMFNPKNFSQSGETEKNKNYPEEEDAGEDAGEIIIQREGEAPGIEERNEPKLSLSSLIRSINVDTFTDKILNNKIIDTKENFSKYVFYRMKKVKVNRMKKTIGDLSLEEDGVRFFYFPLAGIVKKAEKGLTKCYLQTAGADGRVFNNLIFQDTLEKAVKKFVKTYGTMPDAHTMIAGFQYYKKSKANTMYKVLGRIHLFQTSLIGVYCRNIVEKETYDALHIITEQDKNLKFWVPPEDESIGGIIQAEHKEKKILLLFKGRKDELVSFDPSIYVPLAVGKNEPISEESLYEMIEGLE